MDPRSCNAIVLKTTTNLLSFLEGFLSLVPTSRAYSHRSKPVVPDEHPITFVAVSYSDLMLHKSNGTVYCSRSRMITVNQFTLQFLNSFGVFLQRRNVSEISYSKYTLPFSSAYFGTQGIMKHPLIDASLQTRVAAHSWPHLAKMR